jgi:hypothetical protein
MAQFLYGQGNSGPAREVWRIGDRVCWYSNRALRGVVTKPQREPRANETNCVHVRWDDGQLSFHEPNTLDKA